MGSNMMWSQNLMALKLIEFGDSKAIEEDRTYSNSVSTPSYTAPELWTDVQGWQLKKADMWAIGVIAFEMFVGDKCFDENNENAIAQRLFIGELSWPEDRKPSKSMRDFIEKCLALNPLNRLSAEDALCHPWIAGLDCKSSTNVESLNDKESIKCANA